MSETAGKSIRITAGIDEPSFAKATRYVSEMTRAVTALVAATRQLNNAMGGGGGGVSSVTPLAGTGTASISQVGAQQTGRGGGGVGGGVASTMARGVTGSAALIEAASKGTLRAFKTMQDGLRDSVTNSDRYIKKLTGSLEGLEKAYSKIKNGRGIINAENLESVGGRRDQARSLLEAAQAGRAGLQAQMVPKEFMPDGMTGGGGKGGKGGGGWFATNIPSAFGGGGNSVMSQLGQIPGMGALGRIASGPVGMIGAVVAGAGYALNARNENIMSNLNYQIDRPMMYSNARAQAGQVFGGTALAIRHGDLARSIAMGQLKNDPEMKAIVSTEMDAMMQARRNLRTPLGLEGMAQGKFLGSANAGLRGAVGEGITGTGFGGSGVRGLLNTNAQQIARDRANAEAIAEKSQMFQQRLEAKIQEDPMFNDRVNRAYGGALGELGLARASGVGNRLRTVYDADGKRTQISGTNFLKGTAMAAGYDTGEYVGGMQEMAGTVGRSFMGRGTASLLSAKAGGLGNMAQLRAAGSQYNGGDFGGFEKNIQNRIGSGGVDITAASQITGMGASMMQGQFSGTGMGLMSTLLDAGFTGNGGSDMRMARALSSGMGAKGAEMSGSIDPLQKALNASAAMQAAPNAPYAAKNALMNMDPATAMDALRNGRVPPNLANMGVTMSMLQKYTSTLNQTAFSRVSAGMMGEEGTGRAVAKYKAAGGLGFLAGKSRTEVASTLAALAPGLRMAGGAATDEAALGRLRLEAAMTPGVMRGGKGRGAHSAASMKDTIEGAAGMNQARDQIQEGISLAQNKKLITEGIGEAGRTSHSAETMRRVAQNGLSSSSPEQAVQQVSVALMAFVASLKGINGVQSNGKQIAPRAR